MKIYIQAYLERKPISPQPREAKLHQVTRAASADSEKKDFLDAEIQRTPFQLSAFELGFISNDLNTTRIIPHESGKN